MLVGRMKMILVIMNAACILSSFVVLLFFEGYINMSIGKKIFVLNILYCYYIFTSIIIKLRKSLCYTFKGIVIQSSNTLIKLNSF